MLVWPARSADLDPIEHYRIMLVGSRQTRHQKITVNMLSRLQKIHIILNRIHAFNEFTCYGSGRFIFIQVRCNCTDYSPKT